VESLYFLPRIKVVKPFLRKESIMYTSIRRYEGLSPGTIKEIVKLVKKEFVPIVSAGTGFISYQLVDAGNGVMATISLFETEAAAEESNKAAASWVKETLSKLLPNPPQITAAEVRIDQTA
jgi:hypothetical protein